eukprot:838037_1
METPFQRIDNALAQHYKNCGRNDYFDLNEDGKFIQFVKNNALDENAINLELRDVNDPNNCPYIKMDPLFPLASSTTQHQMTNELQNNEILNILKHCYTYGVPPCLNPIHHVLGLSRQPNHYSVFVLTWQHIANALKHELYDKISSSFMAIVNGNGRNTRFENVNELLLCIKLMIDIDQEEVNYIHQLIDRAKAFHGQNCARASHIHATTNHVVGTSTPHDAVIHMDDLFTTIHGSDDKTTMRRILSHLNEEEYDTDALIDDLHDDVARYLNKAQPISQSDTSPEIRLKYYNYDEWMRNTKKIVNGIWASNSPYSTSNLLQIDIKLLHSHENIDSQCGGLNVELLHDIYNVHKCFLLGNYHFTHYDVSQFSKDIQNCKYLKPNIKKYIESVAIESSITTTTIDLYPSYIIEDDMYAACKYFFCASRIVHQETQNNDDFSLRMCVIPNHVICIYDDDIIIPFGIDDIASYLESIHTNPIKLNVSHSKNTAEVTALLQDQMNTIKVKRGITNISNVLCIVEKRPYDHDVLYIILTNSDSTDLLWELNLNYVIALEFNVLSTVECHLRYGRGRIRFYPEHLITIMPRFFKRNCKIDCAQELEKLYADSYKHGFVVETDEMDEFIKFILHQYNSKTWQWVAHFVEWLNTHHYDWDSVLRDVGCNTTKNILIPNQSNIYSFLEGQKQQKLFAILNEKYVQKTKVAALNFGDTVLRWFVYGFKSKYQSLTDEAYNN